MLSSPLLRSLSFGALALGALLATAAPAAAKRLVSEGARTSILIAADGTFTEAFSGVMADPEQVIRLKADPGKRAAIDAEAKRFADAASNPWENRVLAYLGDGRYEVNTLGTGRLPQPGRKEQVLNHSNVFLTATEDTVTYSREAVGKELRDKLDKAAVRDVDEVCIQTALPVIDSNADEKPTTPDGCYLWRVAADEPDRRIFITMARPEAAKGAAKPRR